jgi:hypothetical protein
VLDALDHERIHISHFAHRTEISEWGFQTKKSTHLVAIDGFAEVIVDER